MMWQRWQAWPLFPLVRMKKADTSCCLKRLALSVRWIFITVFAALACCIFPLCCLLFFECLVMKEFAPSDEELEAYRKGEEWNPQKAEEKRKLKVRWRALPLHSHVIDWFWMSYWASVVFGTFRRSEPHWRWKRPVTIRRGPSHPIQTTETNTAIWLEHPLLKTLPTLFKPTGHTAVVRIQTTALHFWPMLTFVLISSPIPTVPVANKRDTRSIEEAMNEIRAKKRLKKGEEEAAGSGSNVWERCVCVCTGTRIVMHSRRVTGWCFTLEQCFTETQLYLWDLVKVKCYAHNSGPELQLYKITVHVSFPNDVFLELIISTHLVFNCLNSFFVWTSHFY